MAVAAQEGRVYVYTLKSMAQMRQELAETSEFKPIKEVSNPCKGLCYRLPANSTVSTRRGFFQTSQSVAQY
jgi:hypothetical protein